MVLCWMVMYLVNDGKSAYATLSKQHKSTLLPRVTTHAYAGCKISGQHPTKLHNKFPRIHEVGHSQKAMLTCFGTNKCSWSRGHLCFKCSSLLACESAAYKPVFQLVFSLIHLAASLYNRPSGTMGDFSL